MVGLRSAREGLTERARHCAERFGPWLCYEEDCLWAIPMYERRDWYERLCELAGGELLAPVDLAKTIEHWTPGYFGRVAVES